MPGGEQDGNPVVEEDIAKLQARLARYPADRYPTQHATTAFHLGTRHLQRGRTAEALPALRDACDLFGRLGMPLEHGKALTMHGVALREAGRGELARQAFERAVQVFGAVEQPAEEAAATYNLGLVLQELGDPVAAQRALGQARALFLQVGDLARAGSAARELGASLLTSGDVESALSVLPEAAALAERGGDLPGLGAATNALGLAHLAADDPAAAVEAFSRAVGAFPRSMRPTEHSMVKANLAVALEQTGDEARARLSARQALAVSSVAGPVRAQAQQLLERLTAGRQADLLTVLEAEPRDRWPAVVREEALRWCDAAAGERVEQVGGFVDGLLRRPGAAYALAQSLLAVLLELPPEPYERLVAAIVRATGEQAHDDSEQARAVFASALARFPIPQWQRLVASLNASAIASGQPASWR